MAEFHPTADYKPDELSIEEQEALRQVLINRNRYPVDEGLAEKDMKDADQEG